MDEPTSSCFQASNANSAAGAAGPLHIRRATDGSYGVVPDQTVLPDAHAYRDCRNMRIAVEMSIATHPPHRTERARFAHSAPTLGA